MGSSAPPEQGDQGSGPKRGSWAKERAYDENLVSRTLAGESKAFEELYERHRYKVFKVEVARRLDIQSRTFAVEPEITAKVAKMKVRVYEVPISYAGRDYEEGKKIHLKDAFIAVWAILRWCMTPLPPEAPGED